MLYEFHLPWANMAILRSITSSGAFCLIEYYLKGDINYIKKPPRQGLRQVGKQKQLPNDNDLVTAAYSAAQNYAHSMCCKIFGCCLLQINLPISCDWFDVNMCKMNHINRKELMIQAEHNKSQQKRGHISCDRVYMHH